MYREMIYFLQAVEDRLKERGSEDITTTILRQFILDAQKKEEKAEKDQIQALDDLDHH